MTETLLPPAPVCMTCSRPISETGGARLLATKFRQRDREKIRKIDALAAEGLRAWECQPCKQCVCDLCGAPWQRPMGQDNLQPDGSSFHYSVYPGSPGCRNTECSRHMPVRPSEAP